MTDTAEPDLAPLTGPQDVSPIPDVATDELTSDLASDLPSGASREPAKRPCGSCPYRRDVPSGIWHPSEYAKLPTYDLPTPEQRPQVFHCHQADGRVCAGWAGCHDMDEALAIRIAGIQGTLPHDVIEAVLDYTTDVPLFATGAEAALHGMADYNDLTPAATRAIDKLTRKKSTRLR